MKRVLVTGGSGFIGSNLVRSLLDNDHEIYLFVQPEDTLWRLQEILEKLHILNIELTDYAAITRVVQAIKPDIIYHLASFGGMPDQSNQKAIFDINFTATVNLFNACKKVGFECFINTGSSSEYGKKNIPMSENLVLEPVSDYAVSKAASTQFCLKEALFNKLPAYTIRPFSVYGDAELFSRLIPTVILSMLGHKTLQLSNPKLVRDFIYIDDMVGALRTVAEKKPQNNFIFNAGSGVQSTIQDVVDAAQACWPTEVNIQWGAHTPRPWEPTSWVADITLSKQILGWSPKFSLTTGIEKTIIWFNNNLHLYQERFKTHGQTTNANRNQSQAH